jgi:hypothetical protein
MEAHVLNLKERTDRWDAFQHNWTESPFHLVREDAIRMDNVYHAVFLKHRELLQQAKDRGETHLLVMEDDAVPCKDYQTRWSRIKTYLDARDDWEVFNGGMLAIRNRVQKITRLNTDDLTTMLLHTDQGCMAHFLYFKVNPALEKIQDWEADGKPEFDAWYSYKLKCVACVPFLAIQSDGKSDATNGDRLWEDRFKHEELSMLFSLREFINA